MADAPATKSEANVKETIESILVAFILAFIFRCFVVEAFVIPTGSMAPTLLGAHMPLRCGYCGYPFTVGYPTRSETFTVPDQAKESFTFHCPNCGNRLPNNSREDADNDGTQPSISYGDRILVMKYVYLLHEPVRWDVVVFKSPETADGTAADYSINYIKRLTGTPGESLFIAQGDLYVAPPGADPTQFASYSVQTKPSWVQDALWRIVYDADHVPKSSPQPDPLAPTAGVTRWEQPWKPESPGNGWHNNDPARNVSPRDFLFDNPSGAGVLLFDKKSNPAKGALTDYLAYNQIVEGGQFQVADLKLSFVLHQFAGTGSVRIGLKKDETRFIGELTRDGVRLLRRNRDWEAEVIAEKKMAIAPGAKVSIQNVDWKVTIFIDGEEVLSTTEKQYAPKLDAIYAKLDHAPEGGAWIEGDHIKAEVRHLQLWRDVYYRDQNTSEVRRATLTDFPNKVVTLGPDEFFVMGDNSAQSSDARMWKNKVFLPEQSLDVEAGRVPRQFMLGKAFFVYWPAGYRPVKSFYAIVPNFGSMRFIR